MLEVVYQGLLEDVDTKEQPAHISYKDMEKLEFQILLTNNYYNNPISIHTFFKPCYIAINQSIKTKQL